MDLLHKKIEYKFSLLFNHVTSEYRPELESLQSDYLMTYTSNVLSSTATVEQLLQTIVCENIIERMDKLANIIIKSESTMEDYCNVNVCYNPTNIQSKVCSLCQGEMIISYDMRYYECLDCSIVESTDKLTIEKKQLPRSKVGNFNPERHFKAWVDRILARESEDELKNPGDETGEKTIQLIKCHLIAKRKSIEHLTIDDIRNVLKETDKTYLNKNTSLIAKKITGRSPPKLDEQKYLTIYSLFLKVMEARDRISNSTRCNRIYYPFYIWKLFSIFLTTPEERKILNYIHLHKEQTLSNNDKEWLEIVNILPELKGKYEPTVNSQCRYI